MTAVVGAGVGVYLYSPSGREAVDALERRFSWVWSAPAWQSVVYRGLVHTFESYNLSSLQRTLTTYLRLSRVPSEHVRPCESISCVSGHGRGHPRGKPRNQTVGCHTTD